MSKTVSARLPDSKHDELRERCNKLGCTMNDFVKSSIEYTLDGETNFDFENEDDFDDEEDDEPSDIEPEPLREKRPNPDIQLDEDKFKPHYDKFGNHWTFDKNQSKWCCKINPENVRITY